MGSISFVCARLAQLIIKSWSSLIFQEIGNFSIYAINCKTVRFYLHKIAV